MKAGMMMEIDELTAQLATAQTELRARAMDDQRNTLARLVADTTIARRDAERIAAKSMIAANGQGAPLEVMTNRHELRIANDRAVAAYREYVARHIFYRKESDDTAQIDGKRERVRVTPDSAVVMWPEPKPPELDEPEPVAATDPPDLINDSDLTYLCGANESPSFRAFAKKCAMWGIEQGKLDMELINAVRGLLSHLSAFKGDDDRYRLRVIGDAVAAHRAEQRVVAAVNRAAGI
jgi:hypothetical protein